MPDLKRLMWLPGLLALAVLLVPGCAWQRGDASSTPSYNVNGTVMLKESQGEQPGGQLSISAHSPGQGNATVTTRTADDGGFHFQLKPGWYLLTADYWGEPAAQVLVAEKGVTSVTITGPSEARATSQAVLVNDVPATIPDQGIWIDGRLVLLKPPPAVLPKIKPEDEVVANLWSAGDLSRRAVLAVVSAPSRLLGEKGHERPLRDRLAWVVVRSFKRPVNVRIGGFVAPGVSVPPILALNGVSLIDARTGEFLLGFFTK